MTSDAFELLYKYIRSTHFQSRLSGSLTAAAQNFFAHDSIKLFFFFFFKSSINTYQGLNTWPIYYCPHLLWLHFTSVNNHRAQQNSFCLPPWALLFTKCSQYLFAKHLQMFSEMIKKTCTRAWFMHLYFYTTNCWITQSAAEEQETHTANKIVTDSSQPYWKWHSVCAA